MTAEGDESGAVPSVRLGHGDTRVVLSPGDRGSSGYADSLGVVVQGRELSAGWGVYAGHDNGFDDLVCFFEGLETAFVGWTGERIFESVEGDLRIVATHRGGRVLLAVHLSPWMMPGAWSVETVVAIEPGEELSAAVRELAHLLRPPAAG